MSTNATPSKTSPLVVASRDNGISLIPQSTPLTRLNYFDGKFLRAEDLGAEQLYLRRLVQLSNQAGGWGVAHGYDLTLSAKSNTLELSSGLAIDSAGRVLLLPAAASIDIGELVDRSRQLAKARGSAIAAGDAFGDCETVAAIPAGTQTPGTSLYVISICHAEALCGTEDVFGKLCEEACAKSTDRPYLVEGILLRATPLLLRTALPGSRAVSLIEKHLRSRVASAFYEDERRRVTSLISEAGLRSEAWCLGADDDQGGCVPIGILGRAGERTIFLDAWTARRERIDTKARRYWQWRMAMRPWDVFLAQILQFQCQLRDLPGDSGTPGTDPCGGANRLMREANEAIGEVGEFHRLVTARFAALNLAERDVPALSGGLTRLSDLGNRLSQAQLALATNTSSRVLIDAGIIELPSAGYLPVAPGEALPVNGQVRNFMGEGLDLRFCAVRPDYVPHALEEAQHMERISLLEGIDDASRKPEVDILVPDGIIVGTTGAAAGTAYEAAGNLLVLSGADATIQPAAQTGLPLAGAAHIDTGQGGGVEFFAAASSAPRTFLSRASTFADREATLVNAARAAALWIGASAGKNPFAGEPIGQTVIDARLVLVTSAEGGPIRPHVTGTLRYRRRVAGQETIVDGTIQGTGEPLKVRASLTASKLRIELFSGDSSLDFTFERDEKQRTTLAARITDVTGRIVDLGNIVFTLNPDVLRTDNELHAIALRAIGVVAKAIGEQGFMETAAHQLFPPPPESKVETVVRATLPWVLFHRRRTRQCALEEPRQEPALARFYRVFHLMIPLRAEGVSPAAVAAALRTNDATFFERNRIEVRQVDVVEFRAGIPVLATDPQTLPQDWQNVPHGTAILHAAIANNPEADAEGDALSTGRLDALASALREEGVFSTVDLVAGPEVLDKVPGVLNSSGVDGVAALVSRQESQGLRPGSIVLNASADPTRISPGTPREVADIVLSGRADPPGATVNISLTITYSAAVANADDSMPRLLIDSPARELTATRVVDQRDAIIFTDVPVTMDDTERKWTVQGVLADTGRAGAGDLINASIKVQPSPGPVSVTPAEVAVATVAAGVERKVRIVVVTDTANGVRIASTDLPLLGVSIGEDGTLSGDGVPPTVIDTLRSAGPFSVVELDTVQAPDANARRRLRSLVTALRPALVARARQEAVKQLPDAERELATVGGAAFEDILFLQR